jgi:hypothetical protein
MFDLDTNHQPVAAAETTPRGATAVTSEWKDVRKVLQDGPLQDRAFKWLATLPAEVRPMATARHYPRIANRIADLWGNCEFTRLYLQSLLNDRRSGRSGFPGPVQKELEALQQYYFENLSGLPAVLWNAVPITEPKLPKKAFAAVSRSTEIELLPL